MDQQPALTTPDAIDPPRTKGDPARRRKLLDAAIEVVATKGIEGVTHRAIAEAAGVPLGATTYYFADKDEIITEAMKVVDQLSTDSINEILAECRELELDEVETMIALTEELSIRRVDLLVVAYRFSLAPLNRVGLRKASHDVQTHWYSTVERHLAGYLDDVAIRLFLLILEGIAVRTVSLDEHPSREEIAQMFRRIKLRED